MFSQTRTEIPNLLKDIEKQCQPLSDSDKEKIYEIMNQLNNGQLYPNIDVSEIENDYAHKKISEYLKLIEERNEQVNALTQRTIANANKKRQLANEEYETKANVILKQNKL